MFKPKSMFSGFSIDDLSKAKEFYTKILGLKAEELPGGMKLSLPSGEAVWAYPKDNHKPTTYTMLDFIVDDIDDAVDTLSKRGVHFERYKDGPSQDEKGIMRGLAAKMGPDIAWFKDPAGNILAVLQPTK